MHATHGGRVFQLDAVAHAFLERLLEQRRLVDLTEHFGDGGPRNVAGDAERFDLTDYPGAAALPDLRLGTRAGERNPAVVERTLLAQPLHGLVYLFRIELPPHETRPKLRL